MGSNGSRNFSRTASASIEQILIVTKAVMVVGTLVGLPQWIVTDCNYLVSAVMVVGTLVGLPLMYSQLQVTNLSRSNGSRNFSRTASARQWH